jgi:hypothetical protein
MSFKYVEQLFRMMAVPLRALYTATYVQRNPGLERNFVFWIFGPERSSCVGFF